MRGRYFVDFRLFFDLMRPRNLWPPGVGWPASSGDFVEPSSGRGVWGLPSSRSSAGWGLALVPRLSRGGGPSVSSHASVHPGPPSAGRVRMAQHGEDEHPSGFQPSIEELLDLDKILFVFDAWDRHLSSPFMAPAYVAAHSQLPSTVSFDSFQKKLEPAADFLGRLFQESSVWPSRAPPPCWLFAGI